MESNDWDLFAVVRGCRRCGDKSTMTMATESLEVQMTSFVDFSRFDELKYFFTSQTQQQQQQQQNLSSSYAATAAARAGAAAPLPRMTNRSRRRRIQQKKVVCRVPADSVSSDTWSWRKYGQKPIKGSPYPRGYYRCSSAKGCPARKQVERSRTDHGTFVITYTADHNHPAQAHRSSLAGPARHMPAAETAELSSPTTTLAASASTDEEEDEEGVLLVEDMEVVGEDEFFIVIDPAANADADVYVDADFDDIWFDSHPQ